MLLDRLYELGYDFNKLSDPLKKEIDYFIDLKNGNEGSSQKVQSFDLALFEHLEILDKGNDQIQQVRNELDFNKKLDSNDSFNSTGIIDLTFNQKNEIKDVDAIATIDKYSEGGQIEKVKRLLGRNYETFVNELNDLAEDPKIIEILSNGLNDGNINDEKLDLSIINISVQSLRPTQNEIDLQKSLLGILLCKYPESIMDMLIGENVVLGSPIVILNKKFILDGHHRWSQVYCMNKNAKMRAVNIQANLDPIKMLKVLQIAIANELKSVPSANVSGENLLAIDPEKFEAFIEANLSKETTLLIYDAEKIKMPVNALAEQYVVGNVEMMRETSQPIENAPSRGYMPQTNQAKNVIKQLTSGSVNYQSPFKMNEGGNVEIYSYFKGINYNYKNSYELNRAIEEYLKMNNDRKYAWTADEKSFLLKYSGYGGLSKFGEFSREERKGLLYEYYTPDAIVKKMWGLAYKYGYGTSDKSVLEPSVGTGNFLRYAPEDARIVGYDINETSVKICQICFPHANIFLKPFEETFIFQNKSIKDDLQDLEKYSLVIGNPPYGTAKSMLLGMGEAKYTKVTNWVEYFITRGLDLLLPSGLLIYVVGAEQYNGGKLFLDTPMSKAKEDIAEKAVLLDAYRLPRKIFERTGVSTEILVFKKK